MDPENTGRKQGGAPPFQPGQSGNPAGRPKGSRNKLGEAFTEARLADFNRDGVAAIERVRVEEPAQYVKVIASLLPKEVKVDVNPLDDLPDDELARLIDVIRAADRTTAAPRDRSEATGGPH